MRYPDNLQKILGQLRPQESYMRSVLINNGYRPKKRFDLLVLQFAKVFNENDISNAGGEGWQKFIDGVKTFAVGAYNFISSSSDSGSTDMDKLLAMQMGQQAASSANTQKYLMYAGIVIALIVTLKITKII